MVFEYKLIVVKLLYTEAGHCKLAAVISCCVLRFPLF